MLEIRNHPAQARDLDNKPMWDDEGKAVPLFPKEASVYLNGRMIALVSETNNVCFVVPKNRLGGAVEEAIELVKRERGGDVGKVGAVPDDPPAEPEPEAETTLWTPGDLDA